MLEPEIDAVIADLLAQGVTVEEVERAKFGISSGAIYARDDMFSGARIFGRALSTGLTVEEVESWQDRVAEITVEQVNEAARFIFDERKSVTGFLLPKTVKNTGKE